MKRSYLEERIVEFVDIMNEPTPFGDHLAMIGLIWIME